MIWINEHSIFSSPLVARKNASANYPRATKGSEWDNEFPASSAPVRRKNNSVIYSAERCKLFEDPLEFLPLGKNSEDLVQEIPKEFLGEILRIFCEAGR